MNCAPLTTQVFNDLIAALTEIRDGYVLSEDRFREPLDVVEGYRYVGQVLSAASELFFEADPEHPRLAPIVSPARKLQGDNPDAIYHYARISGDHSYRIYGTREHECYTSFTIHGASPDGAMAGALLGDVNDRDLHIEHDGTYTIVLSAHEHPGNWIRLDEAAHSVVVRSYFQLPQSAQNDGNIRVRIGIEPLNPAASAPPLSDEVLANRMRAGVAFLRQVTLGQGLPAATSPVPFVSNVANTLPTPFSFRDSGLPVPGAADIHYSMGRWELAEDQALVMTGTLPTCAFVNVMLWNRHMQTLDYSTRQSSLNQAQVELEPDGSYRIVIAHQDPGVANWLDTEGHVTGSIFWRYLLAEQDPPISHCAVVALAELRH